MTINGIPGSIVSGLNAHADALVEGVTYTSAPPVLGGQAGFSLLAAPGNLGVGINASLTGPLGNGGKFDNRTTLSDVFYQGTLKWNQGVKNEDDLHRRQHSERPNRLTNLSFGRAPRSPLSVDFSTRRPRSAQYLDCGTAMRDRHRNNGLWRK